MNLRTASRLCAAATLVAGATSAAALQVGPAHRAPKSDDALVQTFENVSRSTAWTRTATLDLDFETYHPQAMEVVGDRIYLSSVEIIEPTVRFPIPSTATTARRARAGATCSSSTAMASC